MNDQYAEIRAELELTKQELESHLLKSYNMEMASEDVFELHFSKKQQFMIHTINEDLKDVNRALLKMKLGVYGICEETGEHIPIEKLKILPTARTVEDFSYGELYNQEFLYV